MKRILRRRPTPALIISCVALFAALGGTAYALTITGANVRNNSLTGADIRDVKAGDIRNYTLHGRDVKRDSLGRVPIKEERLDASKIGTVKNAEAVGGATARRFDRVHPRRGRLQGAAAPGPARADGPLHHGGRQPARRDRGDHDGERRGGRRRGGRRLAQRRRDRPFRGSPGGAGDPGVRPGEASAAAIAPDGTEFLGQELYTGTSVLGQANKCRYGGIVYVG